MPDAMHAGERATLSDPVTLQIVRGALRAAQSEMEALIERTAMSPFIREKKDFYAALFDAHGQLVVGSNLPVFGDVIAPILEHYPRETMRPGDIYWFNDCYASRGAVSHSPDQVFVAPVFADGELSAFAQSWAHFNDIGGMRPGSLSPDCTEIYQEGIIVPPVRVAREGVMVDELLRLFFRNSRFPEMVRGDTRASIAAIRLGERRLVELFERFGRAKVADTFAALLDETERELRAKLRALLPLGEHRFTDRVDSDGHGTGPIRLRYRLDVTPERITLDTSESDDQVKGPVNFLMSPPVPAMVFGSYLLGEGSSMMNAGVERVIDEVILREGSVLQPRFPAPLGMRGVTMMRNMAACLGLLNVAAGGKAMAGSSSCPMGSPSATAPARPPTATTPSTSSLRRTSRRSSSTRSFRSGCEAMPSTRIPGGRDAGAAAAGLSARSRCWPPRPWYRCASIPSRIRPGVLPAVTPPEAGAASSTRAAPTSVSSSP